MSQGGFKNARAVDRNGWGPLHHACDSSTFCERAALAALDLIENGDCDVNAATTGGRPPMYTPLHFACDGSDKAFMRRHIVEALLDANADMEAQEQNGNTPLLLAAASGCLEIVKYLRQRKCNTRATNKKGVGAWQKASGASTAVQQFMEEVGGLPENLCAAKLYLCPAKLYEALG